MKIRRNSWKSIKIYEKSWESMQIYKNLSKSIKIYENQCKSMYNLWKSMNIYENLWTYMKIMEIHDIYGMYLLRTKKMGYILCSKHIHASHICPPKRNKLSEHRKWKLMFSGKHRLWPVNYISKSIFLWKPEMIPRSLRSFCPKRFPVKPR